MSRCGAWSAMALLVTASLLAGCGQKGPLFMPPPQAGIPAAKATNAPAADNKAKPAETVTPPAAR